MAEQYRKKPVVVEAMQLDGTRESAFAARQWVEEHGGHVHEGPVGEGDAPEPHGPGQYVMIYTPDGRMLACPGDWIIRGTQGEFYPCKPDAFADTFEPVGAGHDMKTPDRANLHAACDLIRETFDGDPARATEIINDRMGPFNPAGDFIVALLTVAINAFSPYPAPARQKRIESIRKIADALPADGKVAATGGAA